MGIRQFKRPIDQLAPKNADHSALLYTTKSISCPYPNRSINLTLMIRLLLNHFFNALKSLQVQTSFMVNPARTKSVVSFVLLMGLMSNTSIFGQTEVDTWYSADRAVNSAPLPNGQLQLFTPLAPADGTPVTWWYDLVDFNDPDKQDAVQHPSNVLNFLLPHPDGFEHSFGSPSFLTPVGSAPGVPTLRRNHMNFNPSIEFDGSGVGDGLYLRPISRGEITLFIVFQAQGAGNTAETQRLLFGGDIENHHSSTTNISVGIADGNRFSVGRTWDGDGGGWFQSGSVDLLGAPTIGTMIRDVDTDGSQQDERFMSFVNGLADIDELRIHSRAEQNLYLYNSLGKHFNSNDSNRNLTGNIAEVLLADGPLDASNRARVESYLAIKYGITLNRAGQLGSIDGNLGYPYLAADGTVIWDPTLNSNIYKFDIAGLGRDRYQDNNGSNPDLRYNLHQRISKSVNAQAIVTMSNNTDFIGDNLEQTRPIIDNTTSSGESLTTTSYLHNYLIWASDRGSVNQTAVELPTGYSVRIEREWQIQKTVSPGGVDPINNVSVRVDLLGSDMLSNPNCGTLVLLIDNDGDGDFLTGTLTSIPATSVDGANNAYFDNVTFEHTQVFTIAFLDDEDPTASDQVSTVCDTPPAVDPDVIDDETDNCGIASVTFISETTDNLSNPETIVRTYRVTDIYGNFIDVTHTIYVYTSPVVDEPADVSACNSYVLPPLTTGSYFTGSGGTGTPLSAGDVITSTQTIYVYAATGPVPCTDEHSFTVNIDGANEAGTPTDLALCEGDATAYDLSAQLAGEDAGGTWTDVDDAFGNGANSVVADPANMDFNAIAPGTYRFTYTVSSTGACPDDSATVEVNIDGANEAGTPTDLALCEGDATAYDLSAQLAGEDAGGTWTDVDDAFGNGANSVVADPANMDFNAIAPGTYRFTYTVSSTGACPDDSATVEVNITIQPDAGDDGAMTICEGSSVTAADLFAQLGGTPDVGGTWTPAPAGPGVYTYTVAANGNCSTSAMAQVTVIEENIGAFVEPVYTCEGGNSISNSILVTLADPSIADNLMYALDSTNPNDFVLNPDFFNIGAGEHTLFIMSNSGCLFDFAFTIDTIDPLQLSLSSESINQITANATGGTVPYTYYFEDENGTTANTYTIDRNGAFFVRVVDSNGCEAIATITLNLVDISIPNFFTPNNDGQNDFWKPRNTEGFPDIETYIFDRYGRKIWIIGPLDQGWDGTYESRPLPSGDYWYIVRLNDGTGREYVGNFTLYR